MNPKLAILQRQMLRKMPEQPTAPASDDLAAAIERVVQERVEVALEQQRKPPAHVQRIRDQFNAPAPVTDYRQLPPTPRTAPAKNMNVQVFRDGAGLMRWITVNDAKFEIQRDGADRIVGMRQVDESPVLPALDIAVKAESRKYKEGV